MNRNRPLIQTLSWLAVLLWMLAIYLLSAQPAGLSNANSKGIVTRVVDTTVKLTKAKIT
ncbi:MAG TPA: phosphotransbutyrylase, partial [Pelotomaculum sp.]|nr:phosphotransbutyrylase [Pelotomaculum sp.]